MHTRASAASCAVPPALSPRRERRGHSRCQLGDRTLGLTCFLPQRFHSHHTAREFVVADDEGQCRAASIGTAKLRLEIAAAEIQLEPQLRQSIPEPFHNGRPGCSSTRAVNDDVYVHARGRRHLLRLHKQLDGKMTTSSYRFDAVLRRCR